MDQLAEREQTAVLENEPSDIICSTCKSGEQESQLILCDGCPAGYHTFCLNPAIDEPPEGRWYCPTCTANRARVKSMLNPKSGHFADCSFRSHINRPQRGRKPPCKHIRTQPDEDSKQFEHCGGTLTLQGCPEDRYGFCFLHYNLVCKDRNWYSGLSSCANRICDMLGMSLSDRYEINQFNMEEILGISPDEDYNHLSEGVRKAAQDVAEYMPDAEAVAEQEDEDDVVEDEDISDEDLPDEEIEDDAEKTVAEQDDPIEDGDLSDEERATACDAVIEISDEEQFLTPQRNIFRALPAVNDTTDVLDISSEAAASALKKELSQLDETQDCLTRAVESVLKRKHEIEGTLQALSKRTRLQ